MEILWRGDDHRSGMDRAGAMKALNRYELAGQGDQRFGTLSGGQQARFLVLLLELSGATVLLLDEPTDNLDLASAEALEEGLQAFEGTVIAVTHDRWFTRSFDRFVLFQGDGEVVETPGAGVGRALGRSSEPVTESGVAELVAVSDGVLTAVVGTSLSRHSIGVCRCLNHFPDRSPSRHIRRRSGACHPCRDGDPTRERA